MNDVCDYLFVLSSITCAGNINQPITPEFSLFSSFFFTMTPYLCRVKSPIDGTSMDGIQSVRIHNAMDCVGDNRTIRWTEVFFIENEDRGTSRCEPVDLSRLAETLARASCLALVPHLDLLKDAGLTRLALRATIDTERVGLVR